MGEASVPWVTGRTASVLCTAIVTTRGRLLQAKFEQKGDFVAKKRAPKKRKKKLLENQVSGRQPTCQWQQQLWPHDAHAGKPFDGPYKSHAALNYKTRQCMWRRVCHTGRKGAGLGRL
jgi:hypothetical protein